MITDNILNFSKKYFLEYKVPASIFFIILFILLFYFFRNLAAGFLMLIVLTALVFYLVRDQAEQNKSVFKLFLFVLILHLCAVMFIYYANFYPFSGGFDYEGYNNNAVEIANRFRQGNFYFFEMSLINFFPVLVAVVYTFTMPSMLVGQMFMAWMSALSVLLLYFLVLEIGGPKKSATIIGVLAGILPSFLLFGSLLLKDNIVIPLLIGGVLLAVKTYKRFSVLKFASFFLVLTALMHLRFYMGFALMFTYIICWFLISSFKIKKRIFLGIIIFILLGFSPYLTGGGYYGYKLFKGFLNFEKIINFREVVYNPATVVVNPSVPAEKKDPDSNLQNPVVPVVPVVVSPGKSSSFAVEVGSENPLKFLGKYLTSFTYSLYGPFPWQITQKSHLLFLTETIPFYILFIIIIFIAFKNYLKNGAKEFFSTYKFSLPIFVFSVFAIGALSLYINNFGIIARIRMPVYLMILCFLAFGGQMDLFAEKIFLNFKKILNVRNSGNI